MSKSTPTQELVAKGSSCINYYIFSWFPSHELLFIIFSCVNYLFFHLQFGY